MVKPDVMAHACNSNTEEQVKGTASSVFGSEALSKRIFLRVLGVVFRLIYQLYIKYK